jgi:hypothetical protein
MCSLAPPWYTSLQRRQRCAPWRRVRADRSNDDEEVLALADKRRILEAEISGTQKAQVRVREKLTIVAGMVEELTRHMHESAVQAHRVTAYREKLINRLSDEAIAASLSGDFTQSRRTMRHLDKVTDRLRVLDERVTSDMAAICKAQFVTLERENKLEELDRKLADCYARRLRLPPGKPAAGPGSEPEFEKLAACLEFLPSGTETPPRDPSPRRTFR